MFAAFRNYLPKRLMKKLTALATHALYSEDDDFGAAVIKLAGNDEGIALLRAYIAIQTAARLTEPLDNDVLEFALNSFCASAQHLARPEFEAILALHKELAEIGWLQRSRTILKGKLAHKNNEYSYEGGVYALERDRKGPITNQERQALKTFAGEISELDHQIEKREQEILSESDPVASANSQVESCVQEMRDEMDRLEDVSVDVEAREVVSTLQQKLRQLLGEEKLERN